MLWDVIGDLKGKKTCVSGKVQKSERDNEYLLRIVITQPQAAFTALTRSLLREWNYLQHVVPDCGDLFNNLEDALSQKYLPTVFWSEVTPEERDLFSLPYRMSGLNVSDPTLLTDDIHATSWRSTDIMVQVIKSDGEYEIEAIVRQQREIKAEALSNKKK